ncbi:PEP-CTERM sorting domain-containing protein [Akkermansia muciniphila]|uniref:PEP-CTERM sorting domain-containing protein n=3 Tax=Akkermansia TaxID=239934 RepID=UPI0011786D3F|nr:PEP-CTERM sorting domain-containing protein [Akkermansia muciniphila]
MKKTLTLLVIGLMANAGAEQITVTGPQTSNNQAGCTGFNFTLTNSGWLTPSAPLADQVLLESLALTTANTWYRNSALGIAIYEKNGETWNFVGKSAWQASAPVGKNTFTFSDLLLSSSTTYTAVFYGHESSFNNLSPESTLTSLAGGQSPSESSPLACAGVRLATNSNGEELYNQNGTIVTNYVPIASFAVQNVPEPATASLSLLGLAALMMRRRV